MGAGVLLAWVYLVVGSLDFANAIRLAQESAPHHHVGALWPVFLLGGPSFIIALVLLGFTLTGHPRKRAQTG